MPSPAFRASVTVALLIAASAFGGEDGDRGDATVREGFETPKASWRREEQDATIELRAHERSSRAAHEGRMSERFAFRAGPGGTLYYSQSVPKVLIGPEARAEVYVRSNRPGIQLFGRIVLPADIDPDTGLASAVLVTGESVTTEDRWQRLELIDLETELARQARLLRIGTNRQVSLDGAYLERLVLNLYGGAGDTEVFVDEMSVGPVLIVREEGQGEGGLANDPEVIGAPPALPDPGDPVANPEGGARVQLVANQITKDGRDWVPTIMDAPGADPVILHQFGFDTITLSREATAEDAERAVRAQLMLIPTLPDGPEWTPEKVMAWVRAYPYKESVAFWNVGDDLGSTRDLKSRKAQLERSRAIIAGLHDLPDDFPKLTVGTVDDMLPQYALAGRSLDLLGIAAEDWATIRGPFDTYRFLNQRREQTAVKNPHAPFLAWLSAAAPPWATRNVWGADEPPSWGRPQVQPEQIRQWAFAALSAGYRAVGFRADAEITEPSARPRLIEMAILNAEIDLVESILARGNDPIVFWDTFPPDPEVLMFFNTNGAAAGQSSSRSSTVTRPQNEVAAHPSIKAASIEVPGRKGDRLLLVNDYATDSQFQPPQMAVGDLKLQIQASENAQAFEITPAGIEVLKRERGTGGLRFTLRPFSGSALVLVTTDLSEKTRLEERVAGLAPVATDLVIQQIRAQLAEAGQVHAVLLAAGHDVRDSSDLLESVAKHLKLASDLRDRLEFSQAWAESKYASRTLRYLKWYHFIKANEKMNYMIRAQGRAEEARPPYYLPSPISSPPLTSYPTLPQHFEWLLWAQGSQGAFGKNLLPSGAFDRGGKGLRDAGWTDVSHETEDVITSVEVLEGAGYGKNNSALRMVVRPTETDPKVLADMIPYLDHEAIAVRSPPIPVHRGGFFRIRVLVRLTSALPSGTGGLIVRDSLGGKPYEMRLTAASYFWREITLYRFAPEDGEMTITLGLAGYAEVYFDRLRVDTITGPGDAEPTPPPPELDPVARRPENPRGDDSTETRPRR